MSLTSGYGKHGYVQSDWAMYFCFSGADTRGWIFRHAGTNVASISSQGHITANYVTGTWLQTTAATAVTTSSKIATLDANGWVYYITPANLVKFSAFTAGAAAGPKINLSVAGTTVTSAAIPSASASASGIVTTGAQTFAGNKTFSGTTTLTTVAASAVHKMPIYWQHSGSRYGEIVVRNNAGTTIGGIISDCGNATTFQKHQWSFRSYCANSTNDTATSGYYEDYKLPESSDGRSSSTSYTILTTKASSLTYQVGRLIATATADADATTANNVALITGSPTGQHLEFDGNEIISKSNGTTGGILYLNSGGTYTQLYKTVFSTAAYGNTLPTSNLVTGQIYFKLI